ncbi:MAG: lipid-A-disaccharide synthase [Candidatus Halichondribacter symbioticus]
MSELRIFIIAGEASGDALGAALMADLNAISPRTPVFAGLGGAGMQGCGLRSMFDIKTLGIMGLAEVLPKIPVLLARIRQTAEALIAFNPDVIITIDSPDFCFRVLKRVKKMVKKPSGKPSGKIGIPAPVIHYVAPSVWAWRPRRAVKMARYVDHVLALLPFEPHYMQDAGMSCDFVGHPAVAGADLTSPQTPDLQGLKDKLNLTGAPIICLLPGSRAGEIRRLLPIFGEVATAITQTHKTAQFILPVASHNLTALIRDITRDWAVQPVLISPDANPTITSANKTAALQIADVALATSGTIALELAAQNCPMISVYKMNWLSVIIAKRMIKVNTGNLVNILTNSRAVPEFLFERCTAGLIAPALLGLLGDSVVQKRALRDAMVALGAGRPAMERAAAMSVLRFLKIKGR